MPYHCVALKKKIPPTTSNFRISKKENYISVCQLFPTFIRSTKCKVVQRTLRWLLPKMQSTYPMLGNSLRKMQSTHPMVGNSLPKMQSTHPMVRNPLHKMQSTHPMVGLSLHKMQSSWRNLKTGLYFLDFGLRKTKYRGFHFTISHKVLTKSQYNGAKNLNCQNVS